MKQLKVKKFTQHYPQNKSPNINGDISKFLFIF